MKKKQAKIGMIIENDRRTFLALKDIKKINGIDKYVFDIYDFFLQGRASLTINKAIDCRKFSWRDRKIATSKQKRFLLKKISFECLERMVENAGKRK